MKNVIYLLLVIGVTVTSCRKDIEDDNEVLVLFREDVTTHLHGRVVNPDGISIVEAEVTVEDRTVFTNIDGYFYFPDISVPNDGFAINVRSENNDRTIRRIIPQQDVNTYEEIILAPGENFQEYDSEMTHFISDVTNSVRITIFANSLMNQEGIPYEGAYAARVQYFDPSDIATMRTMPGNLQGIDRNGERVTLGSYGMFNIEVIGINAERLVLIDEVSAEVSLTIPGVLVQNQPPIVPTWKLDIESGLWIESGESNLINSEFDFGFSNFSIDQFAFWNCDIREENTCLSGKIIDEFGIELENRFVQMTFTSDGNSFQCTGGNTNNLGEFEAKVPKGKTITLGVYDEKCKSLIHSEEIGPFTEETNVQNIVALITEDTYTISGSFFGCNEQPLGNATVFLFGSDERISASTQTKADGSFSIHNTCFDDRFSLKVLDLNTFSSFTLNDFPFTEIDFDIGNYYECEEQSEFINVSSDFFISFNNPEVIYEEDSLVISAETNFGSFHLLASPSPNGNSTVNYLEVRNGDETLSCNSEIENISCSSAVTLNVTEINVDLQYIAGNIDGVLYGSTNPDSLGIKDVFFDFRVNY